jgi:hypothetical protein
MSVARDERNHSGSTCWSKDQVNGVKSRLHNRTSRRLVLLLAAAAVVYAWIAAGLLPFTLPEYVLVALPMVPVVVLTARRVGSAPVESSPGADGGWHRTALLWLAVLLVLITWELLALFSSPREDHPTLSYLADRLMSTHVGRTVVFLAWLILGAALAVRPSRPVRR